MGNHLNNYICKWVWGSDPDPEENKEPPMRSKLQFNVKPNSFKALPRQNHPGWWPPYF